MEKELFNSPISFNSVYIFVYLFVLFHKLMKLRKIFFISIFMVCMMSQLIVYKQSCQSIEQFNKIDRFSNTDIRKFQWKRYPNFRFFHPLNSYISDMIDLDINVGRHTKNSWPDAFKQNKKESKCSWDKIFQTPNANQCCDVAYDFIRYFKEFRLKLPYANSSFIK